MLIYPYKGTLRKLIIFISLYKTKPLEELYNNLCELPIKINCQYILIIHLTYFLQKVDHYK